VTVPQVQLLAVDESSEGQRVDNYLMKVLKGVPKTHIYRLVRAGEVRVNKKRVQADTRLSLGDVVRIPPVRVSEPAPALDGASAPPLEFPVLYEDDCFLAVNKPAGVAVHGGSGVSFGIIEQLRSARPEAKMLELVHRLDRETSGVLLIAKKRSALKHLQDQFRNRTIDKRYLALVQGVWPERQKVVDLELLKYHLQNGERRVKVVPKGTEGAQRSVSLVQVLAQGLAPSTADAVSLLEVKIKTGRTHQIRVHLSHYSAPIAGDDKYGDFQWNKSLQRAGLKRMYLHAFFVNLQHPVTLAPIQINADIPHELVDWSLNWNVKDDQ
jgi:23S rRNA pseudouridine955/2504/2580 synthase